MQPRKRPPDREARSGRSHREHRKSGRRPGGIFRFLLLGTVGVAGLLALILLVLLIGSYTFLPGLVSERISTGLREDLELDRDPEVSVASDPRPNILRGRFSGGDVEIGAGRLYGFNVESIDIALNPFDVDVLTSLRQKEPAYEEPLSGTFRAVVSSDEVARVAREQSGEENVRLEGGQLVVGREQQLFGDATLPIEVRGGLALENPRSLVFTPRSVNVAGVALPEETTENILSGTELAFPIEDTGNGVTLREANISGDQLVFTGDIEERR